MKQVVQNYRSGELSVLEAPVPACKPGGVLVTSLFSLISTGTELMKVSEANLSLIGKARARPDQVRKVVESVAQLGPAAAYRKAASKLDSYTPLGYSVCGVVTVVGDGCEDEFKVGQVVACAGNEHALHAEVNWVPRNLCVPVPAGVDPQLAAFATVGAIALHGVRRAEVQLGETACVIGLGLIGQLTVQLLVAAGARVVGLDPVEERCRLAEACGALACAPPTPEGLEEIERVVTSGGGPGADHVLLTAGGNTNAPVVMAARLARDRGRITDIGKCRLDLPWNDYYEKELEVRFSRSYGPGRYDDRYELDGIDYPAGYVRWTERRNLSSFLDLLSRQQLSLEPLVSGVFPLTDAVDVYRRLEAGELRGIGFLFEYPRRDTLQVVEPVGELVVRSRATTPSPRGPRLRLGFIGAGNYASSMLLPHLAKADEVQLAHVATTTSLSAVNAQRKFGFQQVSTEVGAVLDDESIDALFIVTRHSSHAALACEALERGKAVFVEKPLALSQDELDRILDVVGRTGNDRLLVGFNRRFAPMLVDLRARFGRSTGPSLVRYLVNAGSLPRGSWYLKSDTEGTRFEGEGGHFIDTISWWLGAMPVSVDAVATPGDTELAVTVRFDDHSIASLAYSTGGSRRYPKETFEVAGEGRTARLDNFKSATLWSGGRPKTQRSWSGVDKGQRQLLAAFCAAVRTGAPMPISLESLAGTTRATLAVAQSLGTGQTQNLA
jgi:predicted dehydrogenase/threonine dehydrogenase-like Zn-dependent dehydrogenase